MQRSERAFRFLDPTGKNQMTNNNAFKQQPFVIFLPYGNLSNHFLDSSQCYFGITGGMGKLSCLKSRRILESQRDTHPPFPS